MWKEKSSKEIENAREELRQKGPMYGRIGFFLGAMIADHLYRREANMTFDVSVLFRIAAIGIAIALLNQILTKGNRARGTGHDQDSLSPRRSDNRPGNSYKDDKRIL